MGDLDRSSERLAAFGRWLARERDLRGLGQGEVIRATKLAPGVVAALESGEDARMPPRAYAVGYLRAYAAAVGLDSDEVVLRYEEAVAGLQERPGKRRNAGASSRKVVAALLAAGIAIVGLWFLLRR